MKKLDINLANVGVPDGNFAVRDGFNVGVITLLNEIVDWIESTKLTVEIGFAAEVVEKQCSNCKDWTKELGCLVLINPTGDCIDKGYFYHEFSQL